MAAELGTINPVGPNRFGFSRLGSAKRKNDPADRNHESDSVVRVGTLTDLTADGREMLVLLYRSMAAATAVAANFNTLQAQKPSEGNGSDRWLNKQPIKHKAEPRRPQPHRIREP